MINKIEGTFGTFSGYEGGESYTEKELSTKIRFNSKEPGDYYIKFYTAVAAPLGDVTVILRKGGMKGRYFLFALIAFGLISVFAKRRYE